MHKGHDVAGQRGASVGHTQAHDLKLTGGVWEAHPVVEAAAFHGVVHFTGAVGREDDDGWRSGLHCAELWNGDLEVREHFKQKGLEGLICPVEFIDQQHRWQGLRRVDGLQQRAASQETFTEQIGGQLFT